VVLGKKIVLLTVKGIYNWKQSSLTGKKLPVLQSDQSEVQSLIRTFSRSWWWCVLHV